MAVSVVPRLSSRPSDPTRFQRAAPGLSALAEIQARNEYAPLNRYADSENWSDRSLNGRSARNPGGINGAKGKMVRVSGVEPPRDGRLEPPHLPFCYTRELWWVAREFNPERLRRDPVLQTGAAKRYLTCHPSLAEAERFERS